MMIILIYLKDIKFSETQHTSSYTKISTGWFYHIIMIPKDADRVDPSQTSPRKTV